MASYISSYIACMLINRNHSHIIHVIHSIHVQFCMTFVYCYTWSCVAFWVLLLKRTFSSVLLNVQDVAESCTCSITCGCIMDTLGLFINVQIVRVYLINQASLQVHIKAHFGTMTKCVDYAGVLISSILIKRFHCTYICRVQWSWLCQ